MRNTLSLAAVLVLGVLGMLAAASRGSASDPQQNHQAMEYRVVPLVQAGEAGQLVGKEGAVNQDVVGRIQGRLNDQGKEGWVLVTVSYDMAIFRRQAK